jgi:hypothetical protein
MWSIDPATLEKRVTGLTPTQARAHWASSGTAWPTRERSIRTKDLRLPLGKIVAEFMTRYRALSRARSMTKPGQPGLMSKSARVLNPALPSNYRHPSDTPKARARDKRIIESLTTAKTSNVGRPRRPDSVYIEAVRIYVEALRNGRHPREAVMKEMKVSKSTAAGLIHDARRPPLNLLPPTRRGVPTSAPAIEIAAPKRKRATK